MYRGDNLENLMRNDDEYKSVEQTDGGVHEDDVRSESQDVVDEEGLEYGSEDDVDTGSEGDGQQKDKKKRKKFPRLDLSFNKMIRGKSAP